MEPPSLVENRVARGSARCPHRHQGRESPLREAGFVRLRGKDSNLDYLIQRLVLPMLARVVRCRIVASRAGFRAVAPSVRAAL
jgi:hypothetical protein